MTASDYIKNQPSMQGKNLSIQITFSALAEYPPLSYSKVVSTHANSQASTKDKQPIQSSTEKAAYFLKSQKQHLVTTSYSKPISLKELQNFTTRIFYEDCQYKTDNITKNRTFYEYILVDSKSAEITHYPNKSEPTQIAYSTCKILRIQSPHDFGFLNLHTTKPFSQSGYHIQGYTVEVETITIEICLGF